VALIKLENKGCDNKSGSTTTFGLPSRLLRRTATGKLTLPFGMVYKKMRPSGFEPLTYRLEGTKGSPEPRHETNEITVFYRLKRCIALQCLTVV
jgi:hypothetical protein